MFSLKPRKNLLDDDETAPPPLRRGGPVGGVDPTQPGGPVPPRAPPPAAAPQLAPHSVVGRRPEEAGGAIVYSDDPAVVAARNRQRRGGAASPGMGNPFSNVDRSGQQNFDPTRNGGRPLASASSFANREDIGRPLPSTLGAGPRPPEPTAGVNAAAQRAAAIEAAKRKAREQTEQWKRDHPGETWNGGADEDNVDDLVSLKAQHEKEWQAAQDELAAGKAQALQTAAAKSGAAGFGLSGASAALQGDVGRAADRNEVLTLADLRGKQNDENFAELQREVALFQAEEDNDTDLNHDGIVAGHKVGVDGFGDGDLDNNKLPSDKDKDKKHHDDKVTLKGVEQGAVKALVDFLGGDSASVGSPPKGSTEVPWWVIDAALVTDGKIITDGYRVFIGADGHVYFEPR
jgi:hypothetical protein